MNIHEECFHCPEEVCIRCGGDKGKRMRISNLIQSKRMILMRKNPEDLPRLVLVDQKLKNIQN